MATKYICTEKCFHDGKLYRRGDFAYFAAGEGPLDGSGNLTHFEEAPNQDPTESPPRDGL